MRTVDEAVSDIKSILNNIERTEECYGETLVDIDELCDEILTISCRPQKSQGDKIRAMSDEELAELFSINMGCRFCELFNGCNDECKQTFLNWLKSEVKE